MKTDKLAFATITVLVAVGACLPTALSASLAESSGLVGPSKGVEKERPPGGGSAIVNSALGGPRGNVSEIAPGGGPPPQGEVNFQPPGMLGYPSAIGADVGSMREYLRKTQAVPIFPADSQDLNALGIEVEDGVDWVDGCQLWGAEILRVHPDSPGALAGLQSRSAAAGVFLKTVTFVGTMAFPPIGFVYDFVSDRSIGDRHDLILGVDGERVRNAEELEYSLCHVQPRDVVYLNILRSEERLQIPVSMGAAGHP